MEITKEEKDFIAKAIECYWDVWNINHPDNEKNANMSKGLVKKLNLQNVRNNEVIMKKKKQRELIQSIIKSDEKDDIYGEVMVCDCKKEWSEWEWKHNKCRKCGGIIEY